jgi:hypothetical protein
MPHRNTHFTQSRVLRRDQSRDQIYPSPSCRFGNTGAERWYITNAFILHSQHTPLALTHPSNMTVVSNDPSFWPLINSSMLFSYWSGSSSVLWCVNLTLTCGFAVIAGVVVVYDWGEQDSVRKTAHILIFPVLTIGQEVGWPYRQSTAPNSLNMFL